MCSSSGKYEIKSLSKADAQDKFGECSCISTCAVFFFCDTNEIRTCVRALCLRNAQKIRIVAAAVIFHTITSS